VWTKELGFNFPARGSHQETTGERAVISLKALALGATSGLAAALAVAPFDFVRRGVSSSPSSVIGFSTIFYASAFFGVYFPNRRPDSLSSQCGWALLSASAAALAELPFDQTKRALMGGSAKTQLAANALFIPFGALILVMYDKAILKQQAALGDLK